MKIPSLTRTEYVILRALSTKELFGLEIVERVKELTDQKVILSLGGLYTTLHRMEEKGLIEGRWGELTEVRRGARRRYYRPTAVGERAFKDEFKKVYSAPVPSKVALAYSPSGGFV